MAQTALEKAQHGAALLDEMTPGWMDRVDVGTLDISSLTKCVLGQVYGSFGVGLDFVHAGSDYASQDYVLDHHGFDTKVINGHVTFDQLTSAWRQVVTQRRVDQLFRISV